MISLKKYLDATADVPNLPREPEQDGILSLAVLGYRSALREMGACGVEACPALGQGLKQRLGQIEESLASGLGRATLETAQASIQAQLRDWGCRTAGHYRQKTAEVRDLLLVIARTAESVGERDQRCAGQINEVTTRLSAIASLEDLAEIRLSIEKSAADLKTSLDRMAAEGKEAIAHLQAQVSSYQTRLEEAEELASRDALTGLRNRFWVEGQIERRIAQEAAFSLAIVDIDDFKRVNDNHGHLAGDELLRLFATELKSATSSSDVVGRWGGDEFILLLNSGLDHAQAQIDRLTPWVCGSYEVQARGGSVKLKVQASIGLAGYRQGVAMKELLAQADAAMYARKAASRASGNGSRP